MTDFATTLPASSWDIPCAPEAVGEARALVRDTLTAWGMPALADDAELIVSELVTNALRHGAAPVVLTLSAIGPAALACAVADGGPKLPKLDRQPPGPDAIDGRGLGIVRALARGLGVWPDSGGIGKTIWFTLTAGDAP